ncbi:M1 family metallopeptidase [Mucilaginibacter rubeus]|uniref:M1 family metallopeptidase n=1 Tax=Mucilaginibacter rubeus TaxID=2027860 RepID=A0AAE6JLX6_9SPHI|nr:MULTISPECIES: M1 family metallopeptidase [Mucilaginibacter]QEM07771.1 M1 family metallopeptidase [Mucilaginibacter rubeus]QEM20224.1 M1 family metallopeptidase [Mucilaginibacter gossypii]QTE43059.1 M1 family metallopeptidase [Mucilaginibacter rubeus]QTE49660.1 M1 family metallopeptidase [Mucilaginibacter rubeus]QTE54755.1 M1 family metallopeptidase [Mucilaginibacter rubeus]
MKNKFLNIFAVALGLTVAGITPTQAQLGTNRQTFTRADSLRGSLTPLRTCYDINYYHLDVKFDIDKKFISGSNLFKFTATQNFTKLQFDLFSNLKVEKVVYEGAEIPFTREFNAVFVTFPKTIKKGSKDEFIVYYSGNPTIAKRAPWDGGVVYTTDSLGKPWVATACQGIGASIWWPTKDHQYDEVDSALISISAPNGLKDVSNGRLRKVTDLNNGYTRFDWFVANPINNYDIEANIGDYAHFEGAYQGEKGPLTLDYWPLSYNVDKAKKQWELDAPRMLKSFEYWFGPYPFYEDGYKLVETPHLGMEHQSGTAYGNHYKNGYLGRDLSGTGWGLKWDFIVVHESGHEWFGNNITSKDVADMWIHESFTNYSESLFIETYYGKQAGQEYVNGTRKNIRNDKPIVGPYGVNMEGSGDMYYKGGNLLNMVRTIINNDDKWRSILRGLNKTFYHKTVTYDDIVGYICKQAGMNLAPVFDQYLHYKDIPTLQFVVKDGKLYSKWIADAEGFNMPVRMRVKGGGYIFIKPTTQFNPVKIDGITKDNVEVDTFNYYIKVD